MSFYTALTGLNAASEQLSVTSNNIANVGTNGFKRSTVSFGDIYASSPLQPAGSVVGQGIALKKVSQDFSQGNVSISSNALDMAINGDGFFPIKSSDGLQNLYTRDGSFTLNNQYNVVNAAGQKLMAASVDSSGNADVSSMNPLQIPNQTTGEAQQTSKIGLAVNFPADALVINTPFNKNNPNTYNESTALTVYDQGGNSYLATVYYQKTQNASQTTPTNTWQTYVYVGDQQVDPALMQATDANGQALYMNQYGQMKPASDVSGLVGGNVTTAEFHLSQQTNVQTSSPATAVGVSTTQTGLLTARSGGLDLSQYTPAQLTNLFQVSIDGSSPIGVDLTSLQGAGVVTGATIANALTNQLNQKFGSDNYWNFSKGGGQFALEVGSEKNAQTLNIDLGTKIDGVTASGNMTNDQINDLLNQKIAAQLATAPNVNSGNAQALDLTTINSYNTSIATYNTTHATNPLTAIPVPVVGTTSLASLNTAITANNAIITTNNLTSTTQTPLFSPLGVNITAKYSPVNLGFTFTQTNSDPSATPLDLGIEGVSNSTGTYLPSANSTFGLNNTFSTIDPLTGTYVQTDIVAPNGGSILDSSDQRTGITASFDETSQTFSISSGTTGDTSSIKINTTLLAQTLLGLNESEVATSTVASRGLTSTPATTTGSALSINVNNNFSVNPGMDQQFLVTVDNVSGTVTMPAASNYTLASFVNELQSRINLLKNAAGQSVSGVKVNYDPKSNSFSFTTGTATSNSFIQVTGSSTWGLSGTQAGRGTTSTWIKPQQFTETVNGNNVPMYIDGTGAETTSANGFNGLPAWSPVYLNKGELTFDTNGSLISPKGGTPLNTVYLANGKGALTININYVNSTQLTQPFAVNAQSQDGKPEGELIGVNIGNDGLVEASYSNGTQHALGKVVLANFSNSRGLTQVGNSTFTASSSSGLASLGQPGAAGFGTVRAGALESSNVDLTNELVDLITAQRNFQASAKAIETNSTLTTTVINLRSQ